MRKRFLNIAIALGMIIGLLAGVIGTASAATPTSAYGGQNWIFFPWVPNGETVNGTGPWYGSVTIQNLEDSPIQLTFGPTGGATGGKLTNVSQTAIVNAHAAYTFSASQIFGSDSKVAGGGVAATAAWDPDALPSFCSLQSVATPLVAQRDDDVANTPLTKTADQDILAALPAGAHVDSITGTGGTGTYARGTDFTQSGNEITWISSNRPDLDSFYNVYYSVPFCQAENIVPFIAGVEKQAAPDTNSFGVDTTSSDLVVDGYSAVSDADTAWGASSKVCNTLGGSLGSLGSILDQGNGPSCNNLGSYFLGLPIGAFFGGAKDFGFDGNSYLPIVQNAWSGWDTIINVTNVDASTPSYSAVTVTFYNQDQGVGNQAAAVKQFSLPAGGSMQIDTASIFGTTPFLGSVWITSDFGVVANAVRIKSSTDMALINTSVPSLLATTSPSTTWTTDPITGANISFTPQANGEFQMYAPLVYENYNGWNTGINIANTSEFQNQVTVQFYANDGTSMGTCTTAIPAKGMHYCYIPASQDQGLGNGDFGTAVLTGNMPFAATVDEVKYSTGDAMSYAVTGTTINRDAAFCAPLNNGGAEPGSVTSQDIVFGTTYCSHGSQLSLPLFQNGHNVNGVEHGDTSGINIFNPGSHVASGTVNFYALDGSLQTPSNLGAVPFSVASLSTALIYAPSFAQMTPGIQLTAVVTDTHGRIVAVSNNVNYDVTADGSSVFNLFNWFGQYRYVCSQQQCGLPALVNGVIGQFNINLGN